MDQVQKPATLANINALLREGYPGCSELEQLPLGKQLCELDRLAWTKTNRRLELHDDELMLPAEELERGLRRSGRLFENEEVGEVYREHIKTTLDAMNLLLGPSPGEFCRSAGWTEGHLSDLVTKVWFPMGGGLSGEDHKDAQFLRFVTLYHDIGKVYHKDRHPALGKHLLESLSRGETDQFKELLGGEGFSKMIHLIAYHDLFGTLCTGEASPSALLDAAGLRVSDAEAVAKAIGWIATLNLADIAAKVPRAYMPAKLKVIAEDWFYMTDLLLSTDRPARVPFRSYLDSTILAWAKDPEHVAWRIRRLLEAAILMLPEKHRATGRQLFTPADKKRLAEKVTDEVILNTLARRLGPELTGFCADFDLVCKLDYLLRFIADLVESWVGEGGTCLEDLPPEEIAALVHRVAVERLADIVVELFERLLKNYGDLTRRRDGSPRRIGLELMGLGRAEAISRRVIQLLLSAEPAAGVNWVADEATAWYFI